MPNEINDKSGLEPFRRQRSDRKMKLGHLGKKEVLYEIYTKGMPSDRKITKGRTRAVSTDEQTNHKINEAVCLVTSHTVSTMASMINISSAQSRQLHS